MPESKRTTIDPESATDTLTPRDIESLKAAAIPEYCAASAQLRRVTHQEARDVCGVTYKSTHLEGLAFPYFDPETDRIVTWRVRRDHPELDSDGKPIAKYVSPPDRKHLYLVPGCYSALADTSRLCIIVESEKAVLAIDHAAVVTGRPRPLTIGTGGCWGWRGVTGKATDATGARVDVKGPLPDLDRVKWGHRNVVICFDANAATNTKVQAAERALVTDLAKRGAIVRIVRLPIEDGINGPDDYIGRHGAAKFWAMVDAAPAIDKATPAKAKEAKPRQGREVEFEEPEPWDHPVNGATLLDAMAATFSTYLALPKHAGIALALWTVHAYTLEAWFTTPILAVTSPAKRCGKTLLLIVLGALVPRRLFASNVTPAVLFRAIEKYHPTLLIDEADTFVRDNDELRGVINSGHTRTTAVVIRAVGDDHDPRAFSTWCAKAIALIGKLPGTLSDRSIEIQMRRRGAGEHVARLRQDRIEALCSDLRRQAARWAEDHLSVLRDADPHVPEALHDRAADCWRPLLAIADAAGGRWPQWAREAAEALSGVSPDDDAGTLLLGDIRAIFKQEGNPAEIGSTLLTERLVALEDRPWAEWSKGRPLSSAKLARLLAGYDIHPGGDMRIAKKVLKGYRLAAFTDAFDRYLQAEGEEEKCGTGAPKAQHRDNTNVYAREVVFSKGNTETDCCPLKSATNPIDIESSCAVALREEEKGSEWYPPTAKDGSDGIF